MKSAQAFRAVVLAAALIASPAAGPAAAEEAGGGAPIAVARQFLQAFAKKDFQTIRSLFAPGAVVSTVNLARNGPPTVAYKTADEWIEQTQKELAPVTGIQLEEQEASVLSFDQGATISIRFRATGRAGESSFTNTGIDTYSLARVDGAWRILRYGTFELLEFQ